MAAEDVLRALQEFDVNDLDFENIGSWPLAVKIVVWAIALVAVLFLPCTKFAGESTEGDH